MVHAEIIDRIGYITLQRAEKRNALNAILIERITDIFLEWKETSGVKIIIIKADGDVFSAGADLDYLQQLQKNTLEENLEDSKKLSFLYQMIYNYPKIVISQVEGHAIAGGCGLATVCDFCFSIPEAQFGYTEVKIGFVPALVSVFLTRKIGGAMARNLLLSGKLISANDALDLGLVSEIISKETIKEVVFSFATKLARETSSLSIAMTKNLLNETAILPFDQAMDLAAQCNASARATDDCKKGIAAFLSKEKLVW